MKRILFIGLILSAQAVPPVKRERADALLAVIYHSEGKEIPICQSDLRPDLNGQVPTLKDAILKELIVLDAKKLKIPVADAEIDRALARAQDAFKMSRDELVLFFKENGYTLDQARKELERSILVENTLDSRIKSKSHVSQRALEEYHKQNPIVLYTLSQAYIPYQGGSKALTRVVVERDIASGDILKTAQWQDVGTVQDKDFAAEKASIKDLPESSVVISEEGEDGLTVLRIVSKKLVPFEERKQEIAALLGRDKLVAAQAAYFDKLFKEAIVKYSPGVVQPI
jgi:hypothetical protein